MPTIRVKILQYLLEHNDGADDDELAESLDLTRRQQANNRCHKMEKEGLVERRRVGNKIRNFIADSKRAGLVIRREYESSEADMPWFWEGNVQTYVVEFLKSQGYSIVKAANTRTHERGKDIEARKGDRVLWVTVKGYPEGTERTRPSTQAPHWFKQALFDIVAWRGESSQAKLSIALPDYSRYHDLLDKVAWLLPIANFSILWVHEDGTVAVSKANT